MRSKYNAVEKILMSYQWWPMVEGKAAAPFYARPAYAHEAIPHLLERAMGHIVNGRWNATIQRELLQRLNSRKTGVMQ